MVSLTNGSILGSSSITMNSLRFASFSFVLRERSVSILDDGLLSSVIGSDVVGAVRLRSHGFACGVTVFMLASRSMSELLLLEKAVVPLVMSLESTESALQRGLVE